ncbi:hypothetical protein V6Z12_D04G148500 [Gossypium hirsutum]
MLRRILFQIWILFQIFNSSCRVKGRVVQVAGREKISCSKLMDMSFLAMDLKLALQIMQQLEMDDEYEGNVGVCVCLVFEVWRWTPIFSCFL